jgi:methionyl-tRNA formyltransferase
VQIISQPDRPSGRGKVITPTPVSQWAISNKIDLIRPESADILKTSLAEVDCVLTIGYGVLLPEEILTIPHHGFLNLHFSILPRWRGAAPVQRSIEAGDLVTGVTVFQLDEGMDTGPIYAIDRFALDADISSDELLVELSELGVETVLKSLEMIERGDRPVAQPRDGATRAMKLSRAEGEIDWKLPAEQVSAKIRAFTSNPGAWSKFRDSTIKISAPTISQRTLAPGEIALIEKNLYIGTATQALEIGFITSMGKALTEAPAWANGARLKPGERCE